MSDTDIFIDTERSLSNLIDSISRETVVCLDTEFVRERTYYPQLCLIQIATSEHTACVDCLADIALEPFFTSLLEPDRIWLLHSARQDLEVIFQHTSRLPARLIDTQIAAGLLGYAPQIGLQDLLDDVLEVKLDKAFTRMNWAKRPLPEPAVHYAMDDVRYLSRLWRILESELQERERLGWLEEDCQLALNTSLITPAATLWVRLKGLGSLEDDAKCAALALVEWREACAQRLNRPRRWILSDALLLRIAAALPTKQEQLASIAEVPPRLVERFGSDILAATGEYGGTEKMSLIAAQVDKPRPDKNELKKLQNSAKLRAQELGIHPEVLATRKELMELLVGVACGRSASGWRWEELKDLA